MTEIAQFRGLLWLIAALGPLLILQRLLHREIQTVLLQITRRADLAMMLFSLLFFPGVLLHEGSHFLMAQILRVRTGRFSILPHPLPDGRLQLGYVETAAADPLRETLIGAAPLLAGGAFIAFAGINRLNLLALWSQLQAGGMASLTQLAAGLFAQADFWLWFYLLFTVSSTMLPSASDRRAWLPLGLVTGLLVGLSLLAGAGPWLLAHLAVPLNRLFLNAAVIFFISDFVHIFLLVPVFLLEKFLSYLYSARTGEKDKML